MSAELNITIDQGSTWVKSITWQDSNEDPYDLSTYTARMMIRRNYADKDKRQPLITLTDDSGIALGSSTDNVIITITDAQTEAIPAGEYYWDIELEDASNVVTKLLRGKAFVLPEVTR